MDKYKNPSTCNIEQINSHIQSSVDGDKIITILNTIFPEIIFSVCNNYTTNLKLFYLNWEKACKDIFKCNTQKIIIVNFIPSNKDDEYSVLNNIYSKLTYLGFIVRHNKHIIPCEECGDAILSKDSCTDLEFKFSTKCIFYSNKLSNLDHK